MNQSAFLDFMREVKVGDYVRVEVQEKDREGGTYTRVHQGFYKRIDIYTMLPKQDMVIVLANNTRNAREHKLSDDETIPVERIWNISTSPISRGGKK